MITEEQARMQFGAADQLEEAVAKRRWKGLASERLMLIECEQGILIEIELDKCQKGLRLLGTPDVTPEGLYQLELLVEGRCKPLSLPDPWLRGADATIVAQCMVTNESLWTTIETLLDRLFPV